MYSPRLSMFRTFPIPFLFLLVPSPANAFSPPGNSGNPRPTATTVADEHPAGFRCPQCSKACHNQWNLDRHIWIV